MAVYFYLRVCSKDVNDEKKYYRQEQVLRKFAEENNLTFETEDEKRSNVFKDNCPGNYFGRDEWDKMRYGLREGDTVIVKDVSRFTTDARSGCRECMELFKMGVNMVFVENYTADTDYILNMANEAGEEGMILNHMSVDTMPLLVYSTFKNVLVEREMKQKKIKAGIAASEKRSGREKRGFEKLSPELESDIMRSLKAGSLNQEELMLKHHVSKPTLRNYIDFVRAKLQQK